MKQASSTSVANSTGWEPKCPFDLVVAYEDTPTRNRALQLYDRLGHELMDDYDFQCAWWRFEHLRDESLMSQAIDDAAGAHMIIVSVYGGDVLPDTGRRWLESWADSKARHKSALVALLHGSPEARTGAGQIQTYLQQIARRARMDFFVHLLEDQPSSGPFTAERMSERAQTVTPVLQNILRAPVSHAWTGLNILHPCPPPG